MLLLKHIKEMKNCIACMFFLQIINRLERHKCSQWVIMTKKGDQNPDAKHERVYFGIMGLTLHRYIDMKY